MLHKKYARKKYWRPRLDQMLVFFENVNKAKKVFFLKLIWHDSRKARSLQILKSIPSGNFLLMLSGRDGSSRKLFEPRANRVIDCRVGSSRVILRFELRANWVENQVKIEPDKQIIESKSSQVKKFLSPNFWLSHDIIRISITRKAGDRSNNELSFHL